MECPVCYCDQATCKLVCNHSFCKSCVKSWYQKSEDPSCPMCRHKLYFKGMYKLERIWENERIEKMNQEAFNEEFDGIFEEEDSDWETTTEYSSSEEDDSEWETDSDTGESTPDIVSESRPRVQIFENKYYSDFMLSEIEQLQKNYQKAMELGVGFDWYMNNIMFFNVTYENTCWVEDDIFPHEKNMFVSNHKGVVNNKRCNARVPSKTDTSFTIVLMIEV